YRNIAVCSVGGAMVVNVFRRLVLAIWVLLCLHTGRSQARELTFEDRVKAQGAIERVYYSHQIGVTLPFERAVTRELLEKKVHEYMGESEALESFWHTPVTGASLRREAERIARGTRMPKRLLELYAALHYD